MYKNKNNLIVGNWKMNPSNKEEAIKLVKGVNKNLKESNGVGVGIAPPFVFMDGVSKVISETDINLGAQDVFWKSGTGAFTGAVSAQQLMGADADFTIIGHSERRIYLNESDKQINKKVLISLESGLDVILCIGEDSEIKNKGQEASRDYLKNQIDSNLAGIQEIDMKGSLIIAYEPIWAISTFEGSKPADPEEVEKICGFIKQYVSDNFSLDVKIMYGGSTDSKNVISFLERDNISGALVGSSSLDPQEFSQMISEANKLS